MALPYIRLKEVKRMVPLVPGPEACPPHKAHPVPFPYGLWHSPESL